LFVFGLLMPFSLPVPFVLNLPFLLLALGLCAVKYWLQHGLQNRKLAKQSVHYRILDVPIAVFFAWIFVRYFMNPSIPNLMGFGMNVTGFRSWLSYALAFGILFFIGRFVANRAGLVKLMRWLGYVSIFFILVMVPVTLSKSIALGTLFMRMGMFVATFDNGMLRLVALPEFGLFLLSVLLLPNVLKLRRATWLCAAALASMAVILGGNRTGLGMAFIIVTVIPLLQGKFVKFGVITGSALLISVVAFFAGPALSQLPHTGFLRPLGLVSPALSDVTGGDSNLEWREVRWQRGLEEIRKHPLVGVGYGGLENALESDTQSEEESEDLSVATGGVHNGYIAGALALGIPAALLFCYIMISRIVINGLRAFALRKSDPVMADVHCFICANLLAYSAAFFVAEDMNEPVIWFLLGLGIFVGQLRPEAKKARSAPVIVEPALSRQLA
jgi:O-antigen ligase